MRKVALIDGDIIAYQAAFERRPSSPDNPLDTSDVSSNSEEKEEKTWEEAKEAVDNLMAKVRDESATGYYRGFLSPSRITGYRSGYAISLAYKGNRDNREAPKWLKEIQDYLCEEYGFIKLRSIETDDALGITQVHYLKEKSDVSTIICSKDKDLKQIPGYHYNWTSEEMAKVKNSEAIRLLWKQMLTGDSGDNIIGCGQRETLVYKSGERKGQEYVKRVGVGPKEADKILDSVELNQYASRVLVEYINRFGTFMGTQKYHETFNLVYILRHEMEFEFHNESCFSLEDNFLPWDKSLIETEEDEEF